MKKSQVKVQLIKRIVKCGLCGKWLDLKKEDLAGKWAHYIYRNCYRKTIIIDGD